MKKNTSEAIILSLLLSTMTSCIKQIDLSETGEASQDDYNQPGYIYPFKNEANQVVAQIILKTDGSGELHAIQSAIPPLKYNKSGLFMLTQDDCSHAAYSCTWAAINGKPLLHHVKGNEYYYDAPHLKFGDMPPGTYLLGKTLGSTDGAGNEVRFATTTTLYPEGESMNVKVEVKPGFTKNYYRFYKKSALVWNDIIEMLNYGTGIAFHDVSAPNVNDATSIKTHYEIAHQIIQEKLSGRGCKMLAEPNGNKAYVTAAQQYAPIQTMTAQAGTVKLYPFQVKDDLQKALIQRYFIEPEPIKAFVQEQMRLPKEEREAIYIGVHSTASDNWTQLLLWLNNTYGKDGDDSMWFPSQEEYYEYNYYRTRGTTHVERVDNQTLKLTVSLPSGDYFYYPAVTVNLKGIKKANITSVSSDDAVTGLSYADYEEGLMLNIDCRKFLVEHATHFVEQYEKDKSNKSNKADAGYFVQMLKASTKKTELLNRVK